MTDSPLAFARQAVEVACAAMPARSPEFSRKDFTQHQSFALPAVKQFLRVGYRGPAAYLRDWAELRDALGLEEVPHFTTPQKALARLKEKRPTPS